MADQDLVQTDSGTGTESPVDRDFETTDSGAGTDFSPGGVETTTTLAKSTRDDGKGYEEFRINTGVDRQAQHVRARIHRYQSYARLHNTMDPDGTERETGFESWDG